MRLTFGVSLIPPNPSGKLTVSIQKLDAASFNRNPVRFCPDPFVFVPRRPHPQRRVRATTAPGKHAEAPLERGREVAGVAIAHLCRHLRHVVRAFLYKGKGEVKPPIDHISVDGGAVQPAKSLGKLRLAQKNRMGKLGIRGWAGKIGVQDLACLHDGRLVGAGKARGSKRAAMASASRAATTS